MPDLASFLAWVASAGLLAVIGNVIIQRIRSRGELDAKEIEQRGDLRKSTDEVAIKLLAAADDRIAHWQGENLRLTVRLAQAESELREAREAIELLRQLLFADSVEAREIAERRAHAFLLMLGSRTANHGEQPDQ